MSLPTGYTEVQYIQSTGTQYVDTEVPANSDVRVTAEFVLLENSKSTSCIFGAQGTDSKRYVFCAKSSGIFCSDYGTEYVSGPTVALNEYYTVDKNRNLCTLNGALITCSAATFTDNTNLYIFARSYTSLSPSKIKLYKSSIYAADVLVRNYIPCINSDGEAGLYDTVNSKFYGNAGTGVFLAGPPRVSLPSGYTQLEYILANGAQYVDTGIAVNSQTFDKLEFECDSLYPSLTSSNYLVHGCSGSGVIFYFGLNNTNGTVVYGPGTSDQVTSYKAAANTRYNIVFSPWSKRYAFGENTPVTIVLSSPSGNSNFCLFGFNNGTTCQAHSEKLYSFKARMNGTLIRNFIPCMNAAGAIGLYDLVNSNFYANAGTGVFTAGPEVTRPSNDAIYVKVNGIWRQIDGIKLL